MREITVSLDELSYACILSESKDAGETPQQTLRRIVGEYFTAQLIEHRALIGTITPERGIHVSFPSK